MYLWQQAALGTYYGLSLPVRAWQSASRIKHGMAPVFVIFYHRVTLDVSTPWATSWRAFEKQIRWMRTRFEFVSLEEAQRRIRRGYNTRPCVSITFDDGYAENCDRALPLLLEHQIPITYFVTLENITTGAPFEHDRSLGVFAQPNTLEQLRSLAKAKVDIGCHAREHIDLGPLHDDAAIKAQVVDAGKELEALIRRPVRYFAFPFGQYANLNERAFQIAQASGYDGICSAYGGYNLPGEDPFHLQRIHGDITIRLKNQLTVDPRLPRARRFFYEEAPSAARPCAVDVTECLTNSQ